MTSRSLTELPAAPHPAGRLLSVSRPCPGLQLRDFLQQARGGPRFAMEHRSGGLALAGAGVAAELVAWNGRVAVVGR